jgi:hypothetical protein
VGGGERRGGASGAGRSLGGRVQRRGVGVEAARRAGDQAEVVARAAVVEVVGRRQHIQHTAVGDGLHNLQRHAWGDHKSF